MKQVNMKKLLEMNNKYGISLSVVGIGSMYNSLYNVMENHKKHLPFDVSLTGFDQNSNILPSCVADM